MCINQFNSNITINNVIVHNIFPIFNEKIDNNK